MPQTRNIGCFAHWFQPPYSFVTFLEEQSIKLTKIDYTK